MKMQRNSLMRCAWNNCARKFVDADQYRRHCAEHVEANISKCEEKELIILLPVETWTDVFSGCDHSSLKEQLCFTRRQFHAIARPMLDGPKRRVLPEMTFLSPDEGFGAILIKRVKNDGGGDGSHRLVELPVAEVAPPRNVVGFTEIRLKCFNAKVLSFLCTIRPLLNNIRLELVTTSSNDLKWYSADPERHYRWDYGVDEHNAAALQCLLRVFPRLELAITSLCIRSWNDLISADLLARLLTNVCHLRIQSAPPPPESLSLTETCHNCSPQIPVLSKWLHTPTKDGLQKMACLNIGNIENLAALVAHAQQHLLSGTDSTPIPYFVGIYSMKFNIEIVQLPFETLRNECTGEVLRLRRCREPLYLDRYTQTPWALLHRCASSSSTEQAELEKFAQSMFRSKQRNRLVLSVAQMSQIDESLFAIVEDVGQLEEG